jgi:ATP-dependent Zn protease
MKGYYFEWEKSNSSNHTNGIKNVIDNMVSQLKMKDKFGELSIIEAWQKTLGDNVLRRTENIQIRDRKIYVKIESSALKNELLMNKTNVLFNLNKYAGGDLIDDIILL